MFYHSNHANVSLFALRLIYSRSHPSYAKYKMLSSELFESLLLWDHNAEFNFSAFFSKKQIDMGSVKIILCAWGSGK